MRIAEVLVVLLVVASCRSPHSHQTEVTLLTGERICLDKAVEVDTADPARRFSGDRPAWIEARLGSTSVRLDHAPRSASRPGLDDVAQWIERYPASKVSIDSGQLIWVNAAIREQGAVRDRDRTIVLEPGNGVWSLVVANVGAESVNSHESSSSGEIFWARCERTDSHQVQCERDFDLGGIRATYEFSPEDQAILERDQRVQRELSHALLACR